MKKGDSVGKQNIDFIIKTSSDRSDLIKKIRKLQREKKDLEDIVASKTFITKMLLAKLEDLTTA